MKVANSKNLNKKSAIHEARRFYLVWHLELQAQLAPSLPSQELSSLLFSLFVPVKYIYSDIHKLSYYLTHHTLVMIH